MDAKKSRQETILEVVKKEPIATQQELTKKLKMLGFAVDQGTVSRDIGELGLVKIHSHYKPIEQADAVIPLSSKSIIKRFVRKTSSSLNLMVIKTTVGSAQPVASAIDRLDIPEILGTVAGDDTIIVVLKPKTSHQKIEKQILE